jgi:hypothetical protein
VEQRLPPEVIESTTHPQRGTPVTIAYLDPGSGSLIASALVGGVAAAGVAAKQARAKLGGFGRKKKATADEAPRASEPTGEATEASADDAVDAEAKTAASSDT